MLQKPLFALVMALTPMATWAQDSTAYVKAGVPPIRRKLYLGHEITDVHDLYEEHEVKEFLAKDATWWRGFAGETGKQLQVV